MTKISKLLVIVSAIASLVFLGVAIASFVGGPNWAVEAAQLDEYTFEKSGGETPSWTVKSIRPGPGGQPFTASGPVLADVIVKARNDKLQRQRDELARLDQDTPVYESRLQQSKAAIEADIAAMTTREKQLTDELQALNETVNETTNQAIAKAQEAEQVRTEGERRREDVFRLRTMIAEVRTDKFRAIEQQKKLEDLLVRLGGQTERLERRKEQLNQQIAGAPPKPLLTLPQGSKEPYEEQPKTPKAGDSAPAAEPTPEGAADPDAPSDNNETR